MEAETSLSSSKRPQAVTSTSLSPTTSSSLDASLNSSLATTSSSASSLAGSLSISSLDSALLSRYTSCALLNLPTKLLACSPPLESPPLSLTLLDGLVIAGTQAHGIVSLDPTKQLSRAAAFGSSSSNSGGAVKALLALTQQQQLISADQRGRIRIWRQSRHSGGDDWDFEVAATLPTTTDVLRSAVLPGNYIRLRRHRWQLWLRHADAVSSLAVSAGDKLLVSASWDRSIKVWKSRRCIASLASAHDDAINAVVTADRFFYTGGADGKVKAWELVGERKSTIALVATLYSAGADRVIVVWEREEAATHMSKVDVLKGHRMPVLCLAISSSGQYSILCSGSVSGRGLQGTPGAGQGSGYPPRRAGGC